MVATNQQFVTPRDVARILFRHWRKMTLFFCAIVGLTLVVIAYIASKLRLQIRAFPPLQQTAVVLALLWLNEFLLFWIDGVSGHPITDWRRWLAVPVGAACWPLITGLYARVAQHR